MDVTKIDQQLKILPTQELGRANELLAMKKMKVHLKFVRVETLKITSLHPTLFGGLEFVESAQNPTCPHLRIQPCCFFTTKCSLQIFISASLNV